MSPVEWIGAWWSWIAPASVHAALLGLAVAVLDLTVLRGRSPRLRAALWALPLLRMVLPVTWSSPIGLLPQVAGGPATAGAGAPWSLFALWLVGTAMFATLLLLARRRQLRRWLDGEQQPTPARLREIAAEAARRLGMHRRPSLRVVDGAPGPAVVGSLRPLVVIPTRLLTDESDASLRHVLLHELAHVRRGDPLMALVTLVLQVLFWFHPMVWLARRRLELLRELACDRVASRALGCSRSYRRTLIDMARPTVASRAVAMPAFLRGRSQLLQRLLALQHVPPESRWRRRIATTLWAGTLLVSCAPPVLAPAVLDPGELRGCLQLRYYVHGLLAAEAGAELDR